MWSSQSNSKEESMKALLGITWRGRKIRNKWVRYRQAIKKLLLCPCKTTPVKRLNLSSPTIIPRSPRDWDKQHSMYALQFYQDISRNDYLGFLLLFSNHLWPNIQTLSAVTQPPTGIAGPRPCGSGSSRLCSLPFRFKPLQRSSAETETSGLQDSDSHSLSLPCCPLTRYKAQERRTIPTCPSLPLCWPPAGSVVEAGPHPSSGGFPGSIPASKPRDRGRT